MNSNSYSITVNLAGNFGGKILNEENIFNFTSIVKIQDILNELNAHHKSTFFSFKSIKKNYFIIMIEGQRKEVKELKKLSFMSSETITLLQPVIGG
jgi:hypothetical protein